MTSDEPGGSPASNRLFHRYSNWIVDRPWLTTLLIAVITAAAAMGHFAPGLVIDWLHPTTIKEEKQRGGQATAVDTDQVEVPDVNPFNVSNYNAVILVESDQIFTPNGAKTIKHVVQRLEALDKITTLMWMDKIPTANVFGLPTPLLPHETASQERFDKSREKALRNPIIKGQFLSADAGTALLMVDFDFFYVESNADCIGGLREFCEEAAAEVSDTDMKFSVTGRVPLHITAMSSHEFDAWKYQLVGYTMILIMAIILFRGIYAVLIVAVAPTLGVFWTVGFLPYMELQHNPFTDVLLPVLVSLVGMADGVHLMVHIRKERATGNSVRESARKGVHEVGLACALTSLTTAIGFGSLALASHEIVREFGWCCVVGVICAFISVITTIPLLSSSWFGRNIHLGLEKSLVDKNLSRISEVIDFVLARPKTFSRLAIGITVGLGLLSLCLRPDERNTEGLPTKAEPVVALAKMDKALGGLELARVDIGWSDQVGSDTEEVLAAVTKVDDLLLTEPLIGNPISIRNLIDSMPGDSKAANRMAMLDLLPAELKRAFYTPETRKGNILFRVQDIGIAKYGPVFERIESGLESIRAAHPEFTFTLGGGAVWRWENLYVIIVDMIKSLASASFIIFVVLAVAYKSLRIGLISIIPNLFPLVLSASFLVVTGQYLEFVSVCAFTICLGIAVDDTIHFLTRYKEELAKTDDENTAIRNAFTGVGTALIMTTLVLLSGFITVAFGDAREVRIFASLGGITIGSALLGDLLFLPALLSRYARPRSHVTDGKPEGVSTQV